jgi:hypothetical protein
MTATETSGVAPILTSFKRASLMDQPGPSSHRAQLLATTTLSIVRVTITRVRRDPAAPFVFAFHLAIIAVSPLKQKGHPKVAFS